MSTILVHQIEPKIEFLESALSAFYGRPDFPNKSLKVFKLLNEYLESAAKKEADSDKKQSYSDKMNLLFGRQGNFLSGTHKEAVELIHHYLCSNNNLIEFVLRHDIGMNEVVPMPSRVLIMSKLTGIVNEECGLVEVDCECHNKAFRDYLSKNDRSTMSPDELYNYYLLHASHSPNTRNCVSTAGLIRYIERETWHSKEEALEVIQRLHSLRMVITGDETLDKALNIIVEECLIGIPR